MKFDNPLKYKKLSTQLKHDKARYEYVKEMGKLEDELLHLKPLTHEYAIKLKEYKKMEETLILYDKLMGYNGWLN